MACNNNMVSLERTRTTTSNRDIEWSRRCLGEHDNNINSNHIPQAVAHEKAMLCSSFHSPRKCHASSSGWMVVGEITSSSCRWRRFSTIHGPSEKKNVIATHIIIRTLLQVIVLQYVNEMSNKTLLRLCILWQSSNSSTIVPSRFLIMPLIISNSDSTLLAVHPISWTFSLG